MFRSLGIDTIVFELHIDETTLHRLCTIYRVPQAKGIIKIGNAITIRIYKNGYTLIECVLPKMLYDHNIKLVDDPLGAREAIEKLSQLTGLDIMDAQIRRVDFTLCFVTKYSLQESLAAFRRDLKNYKERDLEYGRYWNRYYERTPTKKSEFVILVYDKKARYLRQSRTDALPPEIELVNDEHLVRIEMRLKRLLARQLKRMRVWASPYFLISDLCSNEGFAALVRFFEKKLPRFLVKSDAASRAKLKITSRMSLYEYIFSDSICSESYEQTLHRLRTNGMIPIKLFTKECANHKTMRTNAVSHEILRTVGEIAAIAYVKYPAHEARHT